ncbi:hypothetical protein PTKIN_Ptkin01aG0250700 [Pterospermum kingtungense]
MDWYFDNGMEDLVVPKGQESTDMLPSPASWSKRGLTALGHFESLNKCFDTYGNLTHAELRFNGQSCKEAEFESSADIKDPSSCSSICGGFSNESHNQGPLSRPQPDYQLDDFARFEQTDDIFLNSLLEDLPCFSPVHQYGKMPADCLPSDVSSDCQSISNNEHGLGSEKYLKTHAFSPSTNLEKEISALRFIPSNSEFRNGLTVKALPAKMSVPSGQKSANGFVSEEISLEESVLQELQMVMTQLSDKTRICFRDAFYRLAKNSEQNPVALNQHGNVYAQTHSPNWTISEGEMRSAKKETTESKTNTIDRTVANLTFNKMETNVRDFPAAPHYTCHL